VAVKKSPTEPAPSVPEKQDATEAEETKVNIKVEDDKKTVAQVVGTVKTPTKSKKHKILTHVIEGFIIQEASEPFPVSR
jgi:hypothetical protein